MAMFNFNLDGQKEVAKPMRSYIDIDADGRPKARVYADEYDTVKSNPDFEPFLSGAGRNVQTAQDAFADEMNEARIEAVEKRIKAKRQETIKAETEAREAAGTSNEYPGIDILGRMIGSQTFGQRATTRQEELKKLLEERSGYMGTPEISAPMDAVGSEPMQEQAPATQNEYINLRSPDGSVQRIKKSAWSGQSKTKPGKKVSEVYLDSGYSIVP
jgi:hypothetical protein